MNAIISSNLCNRNKSTLYFSFIESLLCSRHYAKFIKVSDLILTPLPHFLNDEIDPKSLRGTCSGYVALKFPIEFRLDLFESKAFSPFLCFSVLCNLVRMYLRAGR